MSPKELVVRIAPQEHFGGYLKRPRLSVPARLLFHLGVAVAVVESDGMHAEPLWQMVPQIEAFDSFLVVAVGSDTTSKT